MHWPSRAPGPEARPGRSERSREARVPEAGAPPGRGVERGQRWRGDRERDGDGDRGASSVTVQMYDVLRTTHPPSFQQGATGWLWLNETASSPGPGQTVLPTTWSMSAISTEPTRLPIRAGLADLRDWPILTLTVSAGRLPWPCSTSSTCTEVFPSRRRRCTLVSRPPLTPAFGVRKSRRASCPSRKKSNLIWPCFRCCQERWAFFLPAVCMENSTAHRLASVSMDTLHVLNHLATQSRSWSYRYSTYIVDPPRTCR